MADKTPAEDGFELDGRFYPWKLADHTKDLLLIDRISGLSAEDFFNLVDDETQRERTPITLTLVATSIRAGNPDWSVERILHRVMNMHLSEIVFLDGDEEEPEQRPPDSEEEPEEAEPDSSSLPPAGSSPSSTPEESSPSETLYAIPS